MKLEDATVKAILALIAAGSFIGICAVLIFVKLDPQAQLLTAMLGVLSGSGFTQVYGFYFGSSSSSRAKDETISNLTKPATPPAA